MDNIHLNQYQNDYTKNWCWPVTLLNIMKYRYAVIVKQDFIMTFCTWLAWFKFWTTNGAVFSILYKGFVWALNRKLWLKFKVTLNQISKLSPTDWKTYWLGIKWYSSYKYRRIKEDNIINKKDIDYLASFKWGWIWHNVAWDWTNWWYFIDTNWTKPYKFPLEVLKYWEEKDLFRDNIRTIDPADEFTKKVVHFTIRLFQAEKKGRLNSYIATNYGNKYMQKAVELYMFWK